MNTDERRQQGQAAQPQHRPPPRHRQPPRVRTQGCDREEKSPERITQPMRSAAAQRSGQLARLTEEIRAPGRTSNCCDVVTVDGGDCLHPPQQPCIRHLYNAGQFRLPGGRGLDDTRPHGRRRAIARWGEARSFSSLLMKCWNAAGLTVRTVKLVWAAVGERNHHKPIAIRDPRLLPLVNRIPRERAANSVEFSLYCGGATCSFDQI